VQSTLLSSWAGVLDLMAVIVECGVKPSQKNDRTPPHMWR
jgi:hypothetical protein